jgi:hypothetical protein
MILMTAGVTSCRMPGTTHFSQRHEVRAVTLLADDHVSRLFMQSNVEAHKRDTDARLLEELLDTLGLPPSDVVAVSRGEYHLFVVCTSMIAVAATKGILNKRVEVRDVLPFDQVDELRVIEEGYKDKREYILVLVSRGPATSVRLTWTGWLGEFGGIPAASAETERDRVCQLVRRAIDND